MKKSEKIWERMHALENFCLRLTFAITVIIVLSVLRARTQVYKQLYGKHPSELGSLAKTSSFSE